MFSDQLKEDNVDEVYVTTNNEIVYTLKNDNKNTAWNVTYKTGEIPGVNLYDLLDGKDVKYSAEINTQASPLLNFLLTWILPLILFVGIGQFMGRSLMKRMGGGPGNAMTFGKSNAKIYAESETGITFADVAGEEEAKDCLLYTSKMFEDVRKGASAFCYKSTEAFLNNDRTKSFDLQGYCPVSYTHLGYISPGR